jgi:hypothetical protein
VAQVAYRNDTPLCCNKATERRIFTAPDGVMDYQPWEAYESPASGKVITSKRERQDDFKRTKTRQYEGLEQEKKEADRQSAYQEAESDKALTKSVEMAYGALPESKKKQLQKEIGA